MKKYVFLALFSFVIIIVQCTQPVPKALKFDVPRISAGHGAIFNNGKEVAADEKFIIHTQNSILSFLNKESKQDDALDKKIELIKKHVKDEVLKNALIIDEILNSENSDDIKKSKGNYSRLLTSNNILRSFYVRYIQDEPIFPKEDSPWGKGLTDRLAEILSRSGIGVYVETNANGERYREECEESQVPIPQNIFDDERWDSLGTFENEFISDTYDPELWIYRSDNPPGVCLALPRYNEDNEAELLGIICLNTQNGNTCFFDNNPAIPIFKGVNHPIEDFVGGIDLTAGVCTDCHAGENPFVIHAESENYEAFSNITNEIMPEHWYTPNVPVSNIQMGRERIWPQNPEPEIELSTIVGDRMCTTCHTKGYAGRLPMHLEELEDYCDDVFKTAILREDDGGPTMPPIGNGDLCEYAEQVNHMLRKCGYEEIEPCPDFGFDDFYLDCEVNIVCDILEELRRIPDLEVGCEIIDCCEDCPNFEDYLDVHILWRSDVIKSLQISSISEKGEKITETIYNDKPYKIRLKRTQKDFKNNISFSPNAKEDYKKISKVIAAKKIDVLGKIIVTQLSNFQIASTKKVRLRMKEEEL